MARASASPKRRGNTAEPAAPGHVETGSAPARPVRKGKSLAEAFRAERLKQPEAPLEQPQAPQPPQPAEPAPEPAEPASEPSEPALQSAELAPDASEPGSPPVEPDPQPTEPALRQPQPSPEQAAPASPAMEPDREQPEPALRQAEPAPQLPQPALEQAEPAEPAFVAPDPEPVLAPAVSAAPAPPCTCGDQLSLRAGGFLPERVFDPPLAEIGVGPAMTMRLGQLGIHSTRDLAGCDAETLRFFLGEASRLLDLESWINTARRKLAHSPRL